MKRGAPTHRAAVRALALLCAVLAMWLASAERAARAAAMHPPEAAALGGRVGGCPRAEAAKPPSTRCSTCAPRRGAPPLLLYLYEGPNRVGVIERGAGAGYTTKDTYLFAGIDDALRLKRGSQVVYLETDLAGNVRRLRAPGGGDLGGYRYSAFGKTVEDTAAVDQPHRWKGRWYSQVAGGIYDVRARQWSPQLGAFLTIDELEEADSHSTLWGWPSQNPVSVGDPDGLGGVDSNPVQDLLAAGWLTEGLTTFGKGAQMRANGIAMMANDATFNQGQRMAACGAEMIARGGDQTATEAAAIVGALEGVARLKSPGSYPNLHASGKRYHGQGGRRRSQESGKRIERKYNDPHVATEWTPAPTRRQGYKDEAERLRADKGPKNPMNYNERESPGKRYRVQDGDSE